MGMVERVRRVAELCAEGKTFGEAGKEVGVSEFTARDYGKTPMFRTIMDEFRKAATAKALAKLEAEAERSVEMVVHIRDNSPSDETRLKASFGILDRAMPKQTEHREERVIKLELTGGMLDLAKTALQELAQSGEEFPLLRDATLELEALENDGDSGQA